MATTRNKVMWQEGMLMRPHHFQQQQHYHHDGQLPRGFRT